MKNPKIRFNGYTEAWEQRKAKEIADYSKGAGYSKGDLRETGSPIILYGRLYTNYQFVIGDVDTYAEEKSGTVFSKGDEVIVPASGETAEDIARAAAVVKSGIILGGDINILHPFDYIDSKFLALALSNGEAQKELAKKAQGKSVVHIHNSDIQELDIKYPSLDEQQKISGYFTGIDSLITLHQRKCEQTKMLKKYMLQKMFPQNGSNVPEIRFEGFTEAWEQRKLGELGSCQSGIGFPEAEQGGTNGVPFFKVSDMNISGNEYELLYSNNYVTQDQIERNKWKPITEVPAMFFAKVGAAVMLNRKRLVNKPFLLDNNTMAYKFGEGWDINFGRTLFDTINLASLVQVGALPSYNASDVESIEISLPIIEEQRKIGTYFASLDRLITLHQRKCEELQTIKKYMLQNMFP